ncbi:beta-ketoacyl-ACP synthase III [Jatrophihabitans sp. YIM 134969]
MQQSPTVPGTRILGLGHYQPSQVVTNDDLVARGVDTNDEWIQSRVGVRERRFAAPDETVVDMAEAAGAKALAASGVDPTEVDLVIVATCTMTSVVPNAGPQVGDRLGLGKPAAYDLNAGCAGFAYALNQASASVQAGLARNALVVASERFSGWLDFDDRTTCVILGDGAGAAVVGPSETPGVGPVVWGTEGDKANTIWIDEKTRFFGQEGQAVFRWATSAIPPLALEACARAGVDPRDLAAFVPHQANKRIIDLIAKKLDTPDLLVARDIEVSGNTSAASIPLAFSKLVERGEIPEGAPVLLVGFGAGLSYSAQVVLAP